MSSTQAMTIDQKALVEATDAILMRVPFGYGMTKPEAGRYAEAAITAYLAALPAPDHAGLDGAEEKRIDALRMTAFRTNADADRQAYFDAVSKWFQDRHYRRMESATALSAGARATVKPLDWIERVSGVKRAETILGDYRVWTHHEANGVVFWQLSDGGIKAAGQGTEAECFAAAQADYDRRIFSALSDAPVVTEAEQQVQKLTAENERMREALTPFAFNRARIDLDRFDGETKIEVHFPRANPRKATPAGWVYVDHVLAARSALTQEGER